jgi:photosystem II stability/assembly factor-like uncharacterized protein
MRAIHGWLAVCLIVLLAAPLRGEPREARESREREQEERDRREREPRESGARERDAHERDSEEEAQEVQARSEYRIRQRLDARGEIPPGALMRAKAQLDARTSKHVGPTINDAGLWGWEWLGPGNVGGRARAILVDPTDARKIWLGTAGGGVWRTFDAGASWSPCSDFLPSLAVVSLAMDPNNHQILYAGTGELIGSNCPPYPLDCTPPLSGAGIFKSTDGGSTWTQLAFTNSSDFYYVSKLAAHPTHSGELLAATQSGVWRTTDGGNVWTPLYRPPQPVRDVEYNPVNPNIIFAGTSTDLYRTVTGDTVWTRLSTGAAGLLPPSPGRCEVAVAPSNPNFVYAAVGSYDTADTVYRSLNGGATWSPWMETNADPWSNLLWVAPDDPNLVVWGGFGDLYRTTNGGPDHTQISAWYRYPYPTSTSAHGDQHMMMAAIGYGSANHTVFVANDGGIQSARDIRTVTQTSGWSNLANSLGATQFFSCAAAPDGSLILGGSQDNAMPHFRPPGDVNSWYYPTDPDGNLLTGDGAGVAVNYDNPSQSYFCYPYLFVERSDDGGLSYTPKNNGLTDSGFNTLSEFISPFEMDPNTPSTLYIGGKRIWKTTNSADNWTSIRSARPGQPTCTAIAVSKSSTLVVWIGYSNGLVSHSIDGGNTWIDHTLPVPNRVNDIAINPFAANEAIVTVGGYTTDNLWLTNNYGASWQNRTGTAPFQLPEIQINTITYHPLQPNWIYIGTDMGVFASEDKGVTWGITPTYGGNEGPNNAEVDDLSWQGTTYLIAATHGRGMFRAKPLPIVYVDKVYVGPEDGSEFRPYNTVAEAVAAYGPGALISIKAADYPEPALYIDKRGFVRATGGNAVIH